MIAQLLWHVLNYGMIESLFLMLEYYVILQDLDYDLIKLVLKEDRKNRFLQMSDSN